ncbi:energy transducer TonB [Bosea sp. (in: a-proteobacteria)]|uniref:energy transducer TonB n=1 Tax=Bosea sp. (in: a-proteobacteria) TaxID=1871050 RepID=UPI0027368DBA|nr:TonB family protein [Bosea sp. (in: a-proteobacteria)]MDP3410382.1 TonB family protein [Bosea sp. (in: a-proteobacteria)]
MMATVEPYRWNGALRWAAAALVVAAAHGGAGWVALNWKPASAEAAAGAPEPAIMIDLAAVSVAPEAPAETLPLAPERIESDAPPDPVKETPPPEPMPEPMPVQVPENEIRLPELPAIPDALAVLAPPPPTPAKPATKPPERKPLPKPLVVERKRVERSRQREAAAPAPAPRQALAPSPSSLGASSQTSISTASWRAQLASHLNRYKRFPGDAKPGTVQVAFAIDRAGNVISVRLATSSGDPALDHEAVAMIRRASPVPAPPGGTGGSGSVSLSVPIAFRR